MQELLTQLTCQNVCGLTNIIGCIRGKIEIFVVVKLANKSWVHYPIWVSYVPNLLNDLLALCKRNPTRFRSQTANNENEGSVSMSWRITCKCRYSLYIYIYIIYMYIWHDSNSPSTPYKDNLQRLFRFYLSFKEMPRKENNGFSLLAPMRQINLCQIYNCLSYPDIYRIHTASTLI